MLVHDGLSRRYAVYLPPSADTSRPLALVFDFHGGLGNSRTSERAGFNDVADREGFVVVYPNGTNRLGTHKLLTWNAGGCCGSAQSQGVDDVGFVRAIVANLRTHLNVDPKRIYATGMSNGGMMSHRLGCEAADLFAAIAPVSGTLNFSPCKPSRPISVVEFHGTADQHVPYEGGYGDQSLVHVDFASVSRSLRFWAASDGCESQPISRTSGDVRHDTWAGCAGSTSVELVYDRRRRAVWPNGPGVDATTLIWTFFAAHPMVDACRPNSDGSSGEGIQWAIAVLTRQSCLNSSDGSRPPERPIAVLTERGRRSSIPTSEYLAAREEVREAERALASAKGEQYAIALDLGFKPQADVPRAAPPAKRDVDRAHVRRRTHQARRFGRGPRYGPGSVATPLLCHAVWIPQRRGPARPSAVRPRVGFLRAWSRSSTASGRAVWTRRISGRISPTTPDRPSATSSSVSTTAPSSVYAEGSGWSISSEPYEDVYRALAAGFLDRPGLS